MAVDVRYGEAEALTTANLSVAPGEVVTLLGPSGSGKSTLLHAIAGLLQPSAGEIWLRDRLVATASRCAPPEKREVGLVFQDFALWPHLDALATVAYPLLRARMRRREAEALAQELLDHLDIGSLAHRRPAELSGGQQQRVGLARALARRPRVFLLDEPTAHLDTHLRGAFQASVRDRQAATGAAAVYATHDAGEALALADRVALVVAGRIVQIDAPERVYAEPVSAETAALTGPCSVVTAQVAALPGDRMSVELAGGVAVVPAAGVHGGGARIARVLLRPDWVHLGGPFSGLVAGRAFRGPHTDYELTGTGGAVHVQLPGPPQYGVGAAVTWGMHRAWVLPGEPGPRPTSEPVPAPVQPSAVNAPG
ncbi:MAG: ABC transporter ATP-binding protein [Jatrophihabitans sp.]|uniref:ABC transporter ATP-binding protein n=1 Tax=Jatrophihabitans sp. TaxID=1932789 RepID=UPI003911053D